MMCLNNVTNKSKSVFQPPEPSPWLTAHMLVNTFLWLVCFNHVSGK